MGVSDVDSNCVQEENRRRDLSRRRRTYLGAGKGGACLEVGKQDFTMGLGGGLHKEWSGDMKMGI